MSPYSPLLLLALTGPAWADPPATGAKEIAPYIGESVAVVVRVDVTKLDVEPLARQLLAGVTDKGDREQADAGAAALGRFVDALRKAGAQTLYLLVDPTDMSGTPVVVAPVPEGGDAQAIGKVLSGEGGTPGIAWPRYVTVKAGVLGGAPAAVEKLRAVKPVDRPELAAALAATGDAPLAVVLAPGEVQRKSLEEALPMLPAELGGGPITPLVRGLKWAVMGLETKPAPALKLTVQTSDPAAAKALVGLYDNILKLAGQTPALTEVVKEVSTTKPQVAADRVTVDLDLAKLSTLVGVPLRGARENTRKAQCMNNIKYLGLAMHNYVSEHDTFPPAFRRDKQGKPLLSWRVLVLPHLDAKDLYDQFHLDEPWDSPHNKALISKMPAIYACPSSSPALAAAGKTTYVTPRGKATIFPGGEGVKLQDITDGTSMTLLVLDVPDDHAVVWTKPDDFEVGDAPSRSVLFGKHPNGNPTTLGDGSVKSFSNSKKFTDATFRSLLTRNGGEVINFDDL